MVSQTNLYIERAEGKVLAAKTSFEISTNPEAKKILGLTSERTFFNEVISESYYAIFYAAKAYLSLKGIFTDAPEEHKKTYEEFLKLAKLGILGRELFEIYKDAAVKAETLLDIFFSEKRKRGRFTYKVSSNANLPFAKESIENAKKFVSAIKSLTEK